MESKEQNAVQVAESHSTPTSTTASWLNFNVIHIIVEVAALCGVAVYFTNKINGLKKQVDELTQRLEEQEETIQKHEEILKKLISIRQQQVANYRSPSPMMVHAPPLSSSCVGGVCALPNAEKVEPKVPVQQIQPRAQEIVKPVATTPNMTETLPTISEVSEVNLDEELKDELSELKVETE